MNTHHKLHPLCSIFPPMSEDEFDRLRDDIAKHGQRQPIQLFDGQILDGRHRHDACLLLKIEPKFETFSGTFDEAESLVLSLNLARRHLDSSQRGIVAKRLAKYERGSSPNTSMDVFAMTQAEAATRLNVSVPTVKRAKYVNEHAAPEVIAEVDAGRMSIDKAQKLIAALPDKTRQALAVKADAVDEMIASHAAELQAAAARGAAESKPEWLTDPDEMGMPDVDAMPPLPKTNTHHTAANRRTPDAREMDRIGIVPPDDPRELQDGRLYVWSEAANRLFLATPEELWAAAMKLRPDEIRGLAVAEPAVTTSPVVEPVKESVSNKPGKVPTLSQLRQAVDAKAEWGDALRDSAKDWAAYKMTLAGKDKIRSMESWQKALTRMGNVARDRSVADVCEAIEKAIANGWTGWEHLETSGSRGGSRISTAVRSNRNWDEEIPEWKPTE